MTPKQLTRFWEKVNKEGPTPVHRPDLGSCWLWTACLSDRGYGKLTVSGRSLLAHRVAYVIVNGEIHDDLPLDHLCQVHACVNPTHTEPVPQIVNIRRGRGVSVQNAAKTHCKNGHPFNTKNTYVHAVGRVCRTCQRAAVKRYKQKAAVR